MAGITLSGFHPQRFSNPIAHQEGRNIPCGKDEKPMDLETDGDQMPLQEGSQVVKKETPSVHLSFEGHQLLQATTLHLKTVLNGINDKHYLREALAAMHPGAGKAPNSDAAKSALSRIGVSLTGDLERAILGGDFERAFRALETRRKDVRCLQRAIQAARISDRGEAERALGELGVFLMGDLQRSIYEGSLEKAITSLEEMRRDLFFLQDAINNPGMREQALHQLGVYRIGDIAVAINEKNLPKAFIGLLKARKDIYFLNIAMDHLDAKKEISSEAEKATFELGAFLRGDLLQALLEKDMPNSLEALEQSRKDQFCIQAAIDAIAQQAKDELDLGPAEDALQALAAPLKGGLKKAILAGKLSLALDALDDLRKEERALKRESEREKSYHIEGEIGAGSFGQVSSRIHNRSGAQVVVKKQPADRGSRREDKALDIFKEHDVAHVVHKWESFRTFSSPGRSHQHLNIVMDKLPGDIFSQYLKKKIPFTLDEILSIAFQGDETLGEMQAISYMINDIKTNNMCFDREAQCFSFFDFNLACPMDHPKFSNPKTVLHNPMYRAPEMILKRFPLDSTMDLFCWGLVLVELYLGTPLFASARDNSDQGIREHILALTDQIGLPTKEYLQGCDKDIQKIFACDEAGNPTGIFIEKVPTRAKKWDARMRARCEQRGDDKVKLEKLIHYIAGLLNYAGMREQREVDFDNITFHLDMPLHPDQMVQLFSPSNTAAPILTLKGGISYPCLHVAMDGEAQSVQLLSCLFERGKEIAHLKPVTIDNGEFVDFGFPPRAQGSHPGTPITPLQNSDSFSDKDASSLPPLPSAAASLDLTELQKIASQTGEQPEGQAPAQAMEQQPAKNKRKRVEEKADIERNAKRLDDKLAPPLPLPPQLPVNPPKNRGLLASLSSVKVRKPRQHIPLAALLNAGMADADVPRALQPPELTSNDEENPPYPYAIPSRKEPTKPFVPLGLTQREAGTPQINGFSPDFNYQKVKASLIASKHGSSIRQSMKSLALLPPFTAKSRSMPRPVSNGLGRSHSAVPKEALPLALQSLDQAAFPPRAETPALRIADEDQEADAPYIYEPDDSSFLKVDSEITLPFPSEN